MHKAIFGFLLLLFPLVSLSCSAPHAGPDFDNLIRIEKTGFNEFKAMFPVKAKDLSFGVEVTVGYYPNGDEYRSAEYWKNVSTKKQGSDYVASFNLKKIDGYTPYVQVFWFPEKCCLCGAIGRSRDLVIE